jgi:hypothetical protein
MSRNLVATFALLSLSACSSTSSPTTGGTADGGGAGMDSGGSTGATTFSCPNDKGAKDCTLSKQYCLLSKIKTPSGSIVQSGYCIDLPANCHACACAEADQPKSAGYVDCTTFAEKCSASSGGDITVTCGNAP